MRILKEDTLCIAIDFQEKLVPAILNYEKLVSNTEILLQGLKHLEVPCMVTQQYTKGLGETIPNLKNIVEIPEKTNPMEKTTFSAYAEDSIQKEIENHKKTNIIICGVEAHICVLQTVIDLQNKGYQTILVTNCVGSRKEEDKASAILRSQQEGAIITTYEALLFELMQSAKQESFREIMKLIK